MHEDKFYGPHLLVLDQLLYLNNMTVQKLNDHFDILTKHLLLQSGLVGYLSQYVIFKIHYLLTINVVNDKLTYYIVCR